MPVAFSCSQGMSTPATTPLPAMIPADSVSARPGMRRKSSGQNLLSSFKSRDQAYSQMGSVSSATGSQFATASTPTAPTMPLPRDWDVQSGSSDPSSGANGSLAQGTSVEMLRELVKKRIITLTYLRNVHEGCAVRVQPLVGNVLSRRV